MRDWLNNEDGFQVFEQFALSAGSILLALGVIAVAIYYLSNFWSDIYHSITNL